ncbi:Na+/H+ antiporter NhaC family protein, partial [Staphylococcus aureus]|uniref:Na+/H+ antiporter NhaC family protein n=1 Tax=Staphylococcus aureus TaxID=1280 RepID=UPI00065BC7C8
DGSFGWMVLLDAVSKGIISMDVIAMFGFLIVCLFGIIQLNGGIEWLLQFVRSKVKSKRGAELGIASLVSVADLAAANNSISIILSGPLAKNIAEEYEVDSRISAIILVIFGGCFQCLFPYS